MKQVLNCHLCRSLASIHRGDLCRRSEWTI